MSKLAKYDECKKRMKELEESGALQELKLSIFMNPDFIECAITNSAIDEDVIRKIKKDPKVQKEIEKLLVKTKQFKNDRKTKQGDKIMSKIITKHIKLNENVRGILTINEEKGRFHVFGISGKVGKEEILKTTFKEIKKYATNYFSKIDYSHKLDKTKLVTKGKYYDLLQIYNNLNEAYFDNTLNLNITWFSTKYKRFSHFTFGSFDKSVKLIKIKDVMKFDQ